MDTISSVFLTIVILSAVNGKVLKQEYLYLRDNEVIKPLKHVPKDEKVVPKQRQIIYTVEPQEEVCSSELIKEMGILRKQVKCIPRPTIVDLVSHNGNNMEPSNILVNRCGGMCNAPFKCAPTQKREVKFFVREIRDRVPYCRSITVIEDVECKCQCQLNADQCGKNQVFDAKSCSCLCKKEDYMRCQQLRTRNFLWDSKRCACECKQKRSCTTGFVFDKSKCRCVKSK